jgi:hypothetical protein
MNNFQKQYRSAVKASRKKSQYNAERQREQVLKAAFNTLNSIKIQAAEVAQEATSDRAKRPEITLKIQEYLNKVNAAVDAAQAYSDKAVAEAAAVKEAEANGAKVEAAETATKETEAAKTLLLESHGAAVTAGTEYYKLLSNLGINKLGGSSRRKKTKRRKNKKNNTRRNHIK